ncbi:MAG: ABC transporter permease [Bacteroidota bacterium]|nr:ABC transporter permease [Bacteroidota bacterium]
MNNYTPHITLYNLAFLGTIFVGLTFALQLWFTKRISRTANRFLGLALATIVLWMIREVGIDIGLGAYFPHWSWLPLQFSLALGPLIYFYVLKITRPEYKFRYKDLLHFNPLLLELGAHALEVSESARTSAATYDTLIFRQINPVFYAAAFVSVSVYLYASHRLIGRFYQRLKFTGGDRYRHEMRWLHKLLIGFGVVWLLWIPFTVAGYYYHADAHFYYPLYFLLGVMTIWMAAKVFSKPEVSILPNPAPFLKPPLPAEMKQRGIWLKKAVQTARYYQDPELSLTLLAERLELTTHELSRIINTVLKKSFNDFINEFRVADVVGKMEDPAYAHLTLLGIAFESGFNSKSTFNRAFRQMTGKSAAEHKNELKKERPSYNLTRNAQPAAIISYQQTTPQWSHEKLNRNFMFKNYFKTAWRTLWKQKAFSAINVLGLAIGISASLVIYLIVSYDLSFDKFERDNNRIYRVVSAYDFSGNKVYNTGVAAPTAPAIKTELTGLAAVVPFFTFNYNPKVSIATANPAQPVVFKNQVGFIYADKNYFDLIGYNWLAGSAKTALQQPYQTVLTQSAAALYFPNQQPREVVGKRFYMNDSIAVTVTGVVENIKVNTDLTFNVFVSKSTFELTRFRPSWYNDWSSTSGVSQLLVKLNEGASPEKIEKEMTALCFRHAPKKPGEKYEFNYVLQPLSDIHFNGNYGTYSVPKASKPVLLGLLAVAAFLLLLGCINFINLSTAQATQRAKEIGIRKTIGGSKKQLITQFLSESFLLTFIATALSVALTPVILKAFAGFVPEAVKFNILEQPGIIVFLLILVIVVTLLSGFYPALVLSSYKPVAVLKNQITKGSGGTVKALLRKTLTVSQFAIAQFFIMATILVGKQISFSLHKDMGFKKDAIVYFGLNNPDSSKSRQATLLNMLRSIPEISMISLSSDQPSTYNGYSYEMEYKDGKKALRTVVVLRYADTNYLKLYGIKILAGDNLSSANIKKGILINETYLHMLGFKNPHDVIGKTINWEDVKLVTVCGVVKDFNLRSLHEPIGPLVIASDARNESLVNLLLKPKNANGSTWETALQKAKKAFKDVYPDNDTYNGFFDEDIAKYYQQEQNTASLLNWATILSVFISCLGLLGLVIFTTTQRTKEIGVRKVLGATVSQIIALISKDFLQLVVIAFIIAVPLAWIGMNQWLQNFAFRTTISWWIFAAAALLMLGVAFITLSFQAVRAALTNPVKSLRSE